jgi:hypothetical protein
MGKLLKRWYVWLGLVLLLGLGGSVAIVYAKSSRITQANFDRIQDGMSEEEVTAILGSAGARLSDDDWETQTWKNTPSVIAITFRHGVVIEKRGRIATAWQTLQWYAKKGAAKIGVNWD